MEPSLRWGLGQEEDCYIRVPGWGPGLHSGNKGDWLGEGSELACTIREASLTSERVRPDSLGQ